MAQFVLLEQDFRDRGVVNTDVVLLEYARRDVEGRLADMACCDVPVPAGAISVDNWQEHIDFGLCRATVWREWRRTVISCDRRRRSAGARVVGTQMNADIDDGDPTSVAIPCALPRG